MASISGLTNSSYFGLDSNSVSSFFKTSVAAKGSMSDLTGMLSEYKSIQTGSYGKLMKNYYAKQAGETTAAEKSSESTETSSNTKTTSNTDGTESITNYSALTGTQKANYAIAGTLKEQSAELSASVEVLAESVQDKDDVKAFVKDYNNALSTIRNQAYTDSAYSTYNKQMTNLSSKYAENLSAIGITINNNGSLSIDEEKLGTADQASLKTVFQGTSSFGSKSADLTGDIAKSAASYAASSAKYSNLTASVNTYSSDVTGVLFSDYF